MLFNSWIFLFVFLPVAFAGFYACARWSHRLAEAWLVAASLFFYGWWNPLFLGLLIPSMAFNYTCGVFIQKASIANRENLGRALLAFGIIANLLLLCYFKYLFPFLDWLKVLGLHVPTHWNVILPLGISFFTFTQIGYLIDCTVILKEKQHVLDFLLFVTFFPHLIAGPILHHREMMPQYAKEETYHFNKDNVVVGLSIFIIGLAKKILVADYFASYANMIFNHQNGAGAINPTTNEAWLGALSFSMQLYFDFSGYSDMAIGLARMFNIRFPANFDSPYQSASIIDFWQRWHMTLTRYVTNYLYNPVALWVTHHRAKRGLPIGRQAHKTLVGFGSMVALPTFFTTTLAGIWHGAGFPFLMYGVLHASYLTVNHAWRLIFHKKKAPEPSAMVRWLGLGWKVPLTYLAVLVSQVFFRAETADDAVSMLKSMLGLEVNASGRFIDAHLLYTMVPALIFVLTVPNVLLLFSHYEPTLTVSRSHVILPLQWRPTVLWGAFLGLLFMGVLLIMLANNHGSPFLYFQF